MSKEKQTMFIPGPLPGMNDIIAAAKQTYLAGSHRIAGAAYWKMKKTWNEEIKKCISSSNIIPIDAFTATFTWIEKAKRRDPDNIAASVKFIFDALVKYGIIPNDGWRHNKGWSNNFKTGDDVGVKVILTEVEQIEGEKEVGEIIEIKEIPKLEEVLKEKENPEKESPKLTDFLFLEEEEAHEKGMFSAGEKTIQLKEIRQEIEKNFLLYIKTLGLNLGKNVFLDVRERFDFSVKEISSLLEIDRCKYKRLEKKKNKDLTWEDLSYAHEACLLLVV